MSPKILIEPDDLRRASRGYLAAAQSMRDADRRLRVAPPSMPGGMEGDTIAKVAEITRDLGEQEQYVRDEASELVRRAELAERADGPLQLMLIGLLEMLGIGGVAGLGERFTPGGRFGDREDRRIANDERTRTNPGGRGRGGWLDNDWAGREILERYLRGGDDWTITNDSDWTKYMQANPALTAKLNNLVQRQALDAFDRRGIGPSSESFRSSFPMEIENGEGITGYQYLHGTNATAGGFEFSGSTHIRKVPGGYEVRVPASYTWNDTIDPNSQYTTDKIKSAFAEVITLSRADPYDIHITWSGEATVRLDENGNVLSVRGYPGA